ncbi:hypothetical protein BT67DRAFT_217058 [Trichocladium antarcticum]|uniref:Uncharacterized protein n=1 Tax=Trichocladium antarcticum TaxID=1450529 RepID=A0AAN6UDA7_9PEZI|nr:hypothetical protein BT67DRAFT_217058 [Trichocladium antarcticum]
MRCATNKGGFWCPPVGRQVVPVLCCRLLSRGITALLPSRTFQAWIPFPTATPGHSVAESGGPPWRAARAARPFTCNSPRAMGQAQHGNPCADDLFLMTARLQLQAAVEFPAGQVHLRVWRGAKPTCWSSCCGIQERGTAAVANKPMVIRLEAGCQAARPRLTPSQRRACGPFSDESGIGRVEYFGPSEVRPHV